MRDDFSKLLVERERPRSHDSYHNYRHTKDFQGDDEVGGKRSMRRAYGYNKKEFNENLNPLKGWLQSCVGKKWDKCYSELRKKFDARGTINDHIMQHLWDFIEAKTFVHEGRAMFTNERSYGTKPAQCPIKESYKDFYVCPKDGTVKKTHKMPRRSIVKQREAEKQREKDAIFRVVDKSTHLRLVDDIWFAFTVSELPTPIFRYEKPSGPDRFRVSGYGDGAKYRTWDQLGESEKRQHGHMVVTNGLVVDALSGEKLYRPVVVTGYRGRQHAYGGGSVSKAGKGHYYSSKASASNKQLKQAGLVD